MDKGLRILKLVLLGITVIAIPLLFILQENKIEREKTEKEKELKNEIKAETQLEYKNDIIKLYSDLLTSSKIKDTIKIPVAVRIPVHQYDTVTHLIFDGINRKIYELISYETKSDFEGIKATTSYCIINLDSAQATYIKKICVNFNEKQHQLDKYK